MGFSEQKNTAHTHTFSPDNLGVTLILLREREHTHDNSSSCKKQTTRNSFFNTQHLYKESKYKLSEEWVFQNIKHIDFHALSFYEEGKNE